MSSNACGDHCITCSDEGVPMLVERIDEDEARATRALLEGMGAEYEQELAELRASVIE